MRNTATPKQPCLGGRNARAVPVGNSNSSAFQKTSRSQRMIQSCGFKIWSTTAHQALRVQGKVQGNGMTALGTRPLLSLAPYGTELRCTHARPRPPAFTVLCIRTPKVIGRTLTIVCPWVLQRRGYKASQSMMLSFSSLWESSTNAASNVVPHRRKRTAICVASAWRFSSSYLHIAKPYSFISA